MWELIITGAVILGLIRLALFVRDQHRRDKFDHRCKTDPVFRKAVDRHNDVTYRNAQEMKYRI